MVVKQNSYGSNYYSCTEFKPYPFIYVFLDYPPDYRNYCFKGKRFYFTVEISTGFVFYNPQTELIFTEYLHKATIVDY